MDVHLLAFSMQIINKAVGVARHNSWAINNAGCHLSQTTISHPSVSRTQVIC
jgi:hypothetical protein